MSIISELFKKGDPHAEYMQLELELEDLASAAGFGLSELRRETNGLIDAERLQILLEDQSDEFIERNKRMSELFPLLTPEQRSYHTQDHEDIFNEWNSKIL